MTRLTASRRRLCALIETPAATVAFARPDRTRRARILGRPDGRGANLPGHARTSPGRPGRCNRLNSEDHEEHHRPPHRSARPSRHRPARAGARDPGPDQRRPRAGRVHASSSRRGSPGSPVGDARRRLLERHGRPAHGRPGPRHRRGRRGHHDAVQLRRVGQLPALRAGHAAVRRHRGGQPGHRPGPGRARRDEPDEGDPARPRLRPAVPDRADRGARPRDHGLSIIEDACEGLGSTPRRTTARRLRRRRPSSPSIRTSRSRPARAAWS